jgi:3-oxoacyl-[acyl-carrier protein] reductase
LSARDLEDKVVVVTGGSRGIGRAIVLGAVERGARVAFCARTLGPGAEAVRDEAAARAGAPNRVLAVRADVSKEAEVEALFDAAIERFGRVDVAVNNAAVNRDDLLVRLPVEVFDEVIATNLTSAFLVARRAISEFIAQGEGGRIVSIGSLSENGATSQASYASSKGGLQGLTRTIAKEYGRRGIYANVVVAGYVETELSTGMPEVAKRFLVDACPQRRAGTAEEVAAAVLFLASGRASFVNGETIRAAGGLVDVPL